MSSINFNIQSMQGAVTASIVGNMGAPLRTGEFDERGADPDEIQFSRDPFNFGLVPEDKDEGMSDAQLLEVEGGLAGPSGSVRED